MGTGADAHPDTGRHAVSRALDQTATAFYNTLRERVGGVVDERDLMAAASSLVALGTVRPLIDMTTGKVLGYEYSMMTEKL